MHCFLVRDGVHAAEDIACLLDENSPSSAVANCAVESSHVRVVPRIYSTI